MANRSSSTTSTLVTLFAVLCFLAGCDSTAGTQLSSDLEQARVTSSSGQWDAVLVREDGGGAGGGWEYYVYIVPRGKLVNTSEGPILNAGTLTAAKLTWSRDHLLDIQYEIADINQFTNIWGSSELRKVGGEVEHNYLVEIRLVPSSSDYSLLNSDGTFKSK